MGRSCATQPTLLFSTYTSHLLCHLQSWLASFCLSHILLKNLYSLLPVQTIRARRMKRVLETIFPAVLHQNIHWAPNRTMHKTPSISVLQNHQNHFFRQLMSMIQWLTAYHSPASTGYVVLSIYFRGANRNPNCSIVNIGVHPSFAMLNILSVSHKRQSCAETSQLTLAELSATGSRTTA